jgi:hypothetical protein
MIKFLNVKMVTRNQLVVLLAIAGLLSTAATGTTTVFARSHIHLWLPYGAHAHLWGSGSAPDLDIHCSNGFGWSANVQCSSQVVDNTLKSYPELVGWGFASSQKSKDEKSGMT